MVRLCYHAYLDAVKIGSTVTRAMLREIAREQFESASTEDITAELTHLIEARGWLYEKDKVLGSSESKQPVDYWLPVGEDGAGIAVFLSRSLLQEEEVQALATQAAKVAKKDTSGAAIETVLVINGYLADHLETEVKKAFGRVIVYRLRTFREALDSIVSGIRIRLEERNRENVLAAIKQRVDEIARQNRSIDNQLSHAAQRGVNRVELQAAVSAGLRAVFGHMASNISPSEVNYPQITALFDRAERKVNDLGVPDSLLDLVFGLPDARMREEEWYRLFRLRRRSSNFMDINTESFFRIASKVSVLKGYFSLFRRSIFTLLSKCSDLSSGSSGDFYYMSREILNDVCSLFDGYLNNTDFLTFVQEREPLRKMIDDVFEYVGANKYQLDREAGLISLSEPDVMRIREELRVFLHEVYDAVREELRRIEDVRYRP
jgi:hypothetical protein